MMASGYLPSPWSAEDGGGARLQAVHGEARLGLRNGDALGCVVRNTLLSTMTVLGAPGEVYLLTHSALRARWGLPTTARVERLDPLSLETLDRSPRLKGGAMWPGGLAVHRNGYLYVVYGRHVHKLDRSCQPLQSFRLPINAPYNSFVILDNGIIVTKNLSDTQDARISLIDPDTLESVAADVQCPEPSVARLSALGNSVYVVGVRSIFRYHWSAAAATLVLDPGWRFDYIGTSRQSYGWDAVIDGENAWFMDNGRHRYLYTMKRAGVASTGNRLIRVSLTDITDTTVMPVCGKPGGSVTNPPLVDVQRHIVVAYDSANAYMCAWRFNPGSRELSLLWEKSDFGCASHMLLYAQTGELVVNDYRRMGEEVVVLEIESGREIARVRSGGITQGVVFPSPGWNGDLYWSSMGRLARIHVKHMTH